MATTKEKVGGGTPKAEKSEKKSGGKGKQAATRQRGPHAGADLPVPAPRLKQTYNETVRGKLMEQFALKNPHEVPQLEKIVINVGVGEAIKQPKALDVVVDELATITGQQPVR